MTIEDIKQRNLELELVNDAVKANVIGVLRDAANEKNQKNENTRRLYVYKATNDAKTKFYLELPKEDDAQDGDGEHDATNGAALFNEGASIEVGKLYVFNITEATYKKLVLEQNLLKPAGLIGQLFDQFHNIIYENKSEHIAANDKKILKDAYVQDALQAHITHKQKEFKTDWTRTSNAIGLGDGFWAASAVMFYLFPEDMKTEVGGFIVTPELVANFLSPVALGMIAYQANKTAQLNAYKEKYGVSDEQIPDEVKERIETESKQLGFKMAAAVAGWTIGYEVAAKIWMSFDPKWLVFADASGGTHGAIFLSALVIGLTAAFFLCVMALAIMVNAELKDKKHNEGKAYSAGLTGVGEALINVLKNDSYDLAKLFFIAFFAGASWQIINSYSFGFIDKADATGDGFTFFLAKCAEAVIKGTATGLAVRSIFMNYRKTETDQEVKNMSTFNRWIPVGSVDSSKVKEDRGAKEIKEFPAIANDQGNSSTMVTRVACRT